jgi:hypothetical protein
MKKVDSYTIQLAESEDNPLQYSEEENETFINAYSKGGIVLNPETGEEEFQDSVYEKYRLSEFTAEEQAKLMEVAVILQNKFISE